MARAGLMAKVVEVETEIAGKWLARKTVIRCPEMVMRGHWATNGTGAADETVGPH